MNHLSSHSMLFLDCWYAGSPLLNSCSWGTRTCSMYTRYYLRDQRYSQPRYATRDFEKCNVCATRMVDLAYPTHIPAASYRQNLNNVTKTRSILLGITQVSENQVKKRDQERVDSTMDRLKLLSASLQCQS